MPHTLDDVIYDTVDARLTAKMHKAIAVIQCKLEGQLLARHPEYGMDDRRLFEKTDFRAGTVQLGDTVYPLSDTRFPTVDPDDPLRLTEEEAELVRILGSSFYHSPKLNNHIKFLYAKGSMYRTCNGNLLYHGCIPLNEDGSFREVCLPKIGTEEDTGTCHGKKLLDRIGQIVNRAYFAPYDSPEQIECRDFLWYLWCGPDSPLFGKSKMAFFERTFIDKHLPEAKEVYDPYYSLNRSWEVCGRILEEFGLDPENGHVPVLIKDGESPIRGGGRLYVIDGGISKAYRVKTGIAGYTLIYDSHSLRLAEHHAGDTDTPTVRVVEKMERRVSIADTDYGEELALRIEDLRALLQAYRDGVILEK